MSTAVRENGIAPQPASEEREQPLAEPLLDAVGAGRLLGVKPSWIYEAARMGRIPHLRLGRHVRFLRSDLEEWVLAKRVGGGSVPRR